jgi:hypothetical protein
MSEPFKSIATPLERVDRAEVWSHPPSTRERRWEATVRRVEHELRAVEAERDRLRAALEEIAVILDCAGLADPKLHVKDVP